MLAQVEHYYSFKSESIDKLLRQKTQLYVKFHESLENYGAKQSPIEKKEKFLRKLTPVLFLRNLDHLYQILSIIFLCSKNYFEIFPNILCMK